MSGRNEVGADSYPIATEKRTHQGKTEACSATVTVDIISLESFNIFEKQFKGAAYLRDLNGLGFEYSFKKRKLTLRGYGIWELSCRNHFYCWRL